MLVRYALLALAAALLCGAPAHADGTVYRANRCGGYIFVTTRTGFSVLVGDSGQGIKDGDALRGDVERIGTPTLFDETAGRTLFANVSELHLTRSEITQRIAVRCRSSLGDTIVSGYVERAAGCGNKIFVSTPQGYAVLERIAGGVVADGDTLSGYLNHAGRITVRDQQSNASLVMFVDDIWLSKSAVQRRMAASCRR